METDLGNVSPNPKGTYDNATAYEYLDLVEYQGGSYLCITALGTKITGTAPTPGKNTDVWQTVALPGNLTKEYLDKHADVIEKAKQVETSRAAVELCKQEVESAQADVEQMRQDTQQAAQNASDANTEAQQAAQQAEASRSAAQTSEQNAAASRDLANTYKANAETAKSAAETAAQEANESKTAAETAAQNAAQSKADIDSIKADIEEAAKGENVSQIQKNMNDIGQLKEELEECIDVTASRNILAFENYTRGKYYSASSGGDKYNDSFTAIDDYVKIEPNTDYVFSIFSDGNYETMPNALVIQYDAGRKYISGADVKTFKTTINARYIRLSMANVYFDKQVMLEKGTEPSKIYESPLIGKNYKIKNECIDDTQICDKVISILKEDLDNSEERNIDPLNKAVFGSRKLLLATPIDEDWSGYMNEKGEIYAKDNSDRWHKTYRLCSEDTTIKVKDYAGGNIKHCIFLDRSNNVISTTVGAWTQKMLDVSVPSGAKYVVVNATDSADMIVCYTHIFDTDYNVAEKMNDVNIRMNSAEATIGNVKESLNSVTDTVFSEKKYASLKSVEETKKVTNRGTFDRGGRANAYIVNTYIGQTLKARGYSGGNIPLIVFFDSDDKFISYINPSNAWNNNVYQDVVVPEGAYKAYVNDNDGDRTIDLQGLQFEKYNIKQELERLEGLIPDSSKISYDLEQAQLQMAKTQRMNDFAYSKFDKAYFVLTIDDANKWLPDVYDLCHELGVPLCPAIIVGNLNTDYKNDGRTIKDICDLVVADGGEILAHSGKYITKESTEEDYADVFRMPKIELEKLGYDIRGIITAGGVGYLSNDIRLDNWSRKYYDYSDQNGISSSKAYYRPRWWHHDYTMDGAKKYVDNAISNKSFVVMDMHGSDNADDLEHIDHVRELLQFIISKGSDKIEITTWAKVYDTFGSTVLEERIKALEEKVSN